MIKKLLSTSLLAAFALGASAYGVNDFVYTKNARFKITGDNLVQNGQFNQGATGTDGWNAIDATAAPLTATFLMKEGGPNGSNTLAVNAGCNGLEAGMYQKISIPAGGMYVVSFEIIGATAGFTDLDMTGGNTNYINAYYNADVDKDSIASAGGIYGTNGVPGGYQFSYTPDGFTSVAFAVNAPAEGNIYIDFRGMNDGVEIANVECHLAESVYDNRIAERRVAYLKKFLDGGEFEGKYFYDEFMMAIADVEAGVAANKPADEMLTLMSNLETAWGEFSGSGETYDNILDFISSTDGSSVNPDPETGLNQNNSNWQYWIGSGKLEKLSNAYRGKAPWQWSSDRWRVDYYTRATADGDIGEVCHGISWARGGSQPTAHTATLTVTLDKGTYFWGASGEGGMMTLTKNSWNRSWAKQCISTQFFFNGDTTEIIPLDPAIRNDYVFKYEVEEDGTELTLGMILHIENPADGANAGFYNPILYKVLEDGELTADQLNYLANVQVQMEALKGRLDVADAYLAPEQTTMPWGKETLQEGVTEAQNRYNAWAALTQDEILEMQFNYETLSDTIMNFGVRFLNNNYITPFEKLNAPFASLLSAVDAATAVKDMRIYASSSKMGDLEAKIAESQNLHDATLLKPFSQEDSLALVNQKPALEAVVEEFKAAIAATTVVDIDFGEQHAPAKIDTISSPEGLFETYYQINGKDGKGAITWTANFLLGAGTDSIGKFRVGNGEAVVDLSGIPMNESDIVNIQFDYYFGSLSKKFAGYKVLTEAGEEICGLYINRYNGQQEVNTYEIDWGPYVTGRDNKTDGDRNIAHPDNRTHFDLVLDFGARKQICTITNAKNGSVTSADKDLPFMAPAKFVVYSNYNNEGRRCFFDNLVIRNIAAEATGVNEVQNVEKAADSNAMYNLAGQKIAAPVKGQVYIQGGVAKVAR